MSRVSRTKVTNILNSNQVFTINISTFLLSGSGQHVLLMLALLYLLYQYTKQYGGGGGASPGIKVNLVSKVSLSHTFKDRIY